MLCIALWQGLCDGNITLVPLSTRCYCIISMWCSRVRDWCLASALSAILTHFLIDNIEMIYHSIATAILTVIQYTDYIHFIKHIIQTNTKFSNGAWVAISLLATQRHFCCDKWNECQFKVQEETRVPGENLRDTIRN